MPYDKAFFKRYEDYLKERTVRENHDRAFHAFDEQCTDLLKIGARVIDLGCGVGEFQRHGKYAAYLGIDLKPARRGRAFRKADYRLGIPDGLPFVPNAFVSLFSIEACLPAAERYALYDRIFRENPSIVIGLSAGFYYASRSREETVSEADGAIVSYQSIDRPEDHTKQGYHEERRLMLTPSALFGDDVVEVWKTLLRH